MDIRFAAIISVAISFAGVLKEAATLLIKFTIISQPAHYVLQNPKHSLVFSRWIY